MASTSPSPTPSSGATTARQALDNGADIVFGAGGQTGNGALIEVAKDEGKLCIGVDTDQWETVPEAHPCLITSAMKLIDQGVVDLVNQAVDGSIVGGNFFGEVGLADFHDLADRVPDDVKAQIEELTDGRSSSGEVADRLPAVVSARSQITVTGCGRLCRTPSSYPP